MRMNRNAGLRKSLGWISLTALGIGAIIGTGIFVLTGTAAAGESVEYPSILKAPLLQVLLHGSHAAGVDGRPGAGPAIALSFSSWPSPVDLPRFMLCRARVHDSNCRAQRAYTCVCNDGRTGRLDYWLGISQSWNMPFPTWPWPSAFPLTSTACWNLLDFISLHRFRHPLTLP